MWVGKEEGDTVLKRIQALFQMQAYQKENSACFQQQGKLKSN